MRRIRNTTAAETIFCFIRDLDDRVKMYVTILAGLVAFICIDVRSMLMLSAFALVLGWLCGLKKTIAATLIVWFVLGPVMWGLNLFPFLGPFIPGSGLFSLVVTFTPMVVIMMVMYASLNVSRFVHTLERSGLPRGFVIPLGVSIRFVPSLAEEWEHTRNAMKFRGIGVSFGNVMRKPLATIEYILIPLLMRALAISDELARTALTRAIDHPGPKNSLYTVRFGAKDALAAVFWSGFMVLFVWLDRLFQGLAS